ncbi:MAG: hypothetical protein H0V93_02370 [Euzebyales bacterium]|nr:hypothetical protein [Euzebyales bacterium]
MVEGWADAWRRAHTAPTEAHQRQLRDLYAEQPQVTYGAAELDQPEGRPAADPELEIVGRVMDPRTTNRHWSGPVLVVERAEPLPAGPADLRIRVDTTTRRVFQMESGEAVPNTSALAAPSVTVLDVVGQADGDWRIVAEHRTEVAGRLANGYSGPRPSQVGESEP